MVPNEAIMVQYSTTSAAYWQNDFFPFRHGGSDIVREDKYKLEASHKKALSVMSVYKGGIYGFQGPPGTAR